MLKKEKACKTWAYVTQKEDNKKLLLHFFGSCIICIALIPFLNIIFLLYNSKIFHRTPKFDEKKDPNESLMDLMKKMYDEGDDEMKRTIAKSFSESRNKAAASGDF